jgi:hypothetical protein
MPLDPFTALSVAASVVQFVDFARTIVSKGKELYNSPGGALRENEETETVTMRLHVLSQKLKETFQDATRTPQRPANVSAQLDRQDRQRLEVQEYPGLPDICNECAAVSAELIKHLRDLKVPKGQEHRQWKSFRHALKSVWSKNGVDEMARRLSHLRQELDTHVLVLLR